MKYKIVVPKHGKNAGVVSIEGMEHNENCVAELEKVAVGFGPVKSIEKKDHFGDDNPVFDSVQIKE
jgi:hypothetical protein